ncbi:SIMPL domain-containing protein [Haloplanus halophilus]|uniref:SIMPL domain-containing protein n=1 Tax=Haloplanus halophilus TaxID=2949993 RepID=UPI00203B30B9|nr:SIMPL domain-containing protein [Haloplanus sp. GDY1]
MQRHALLTVGLAVLLVIAGCSAGTSSPAATADSPTTPDSDSTIEVAGTGSADAEPNQAVVRVSVVATGDTAATARERLAANTSRMRSALREAGVDEDRIVTQRYDIYQDRRRPPEEGAEPRIQYRASHSFEITVTDPGRVGGVVDTAVANGATEIDDVTFTLSTERRRELERRARSAAMADARAKAESLAADADLSVTGVNVIQTTEAGVPRPVDEAAYMTATPAATGAPPTDIESGPVTVRTTVRVVYEAGPEGNATGE